ncbi:AMP-binding protein, partial [Micromonospora sp. NPDC049903]|uniref:AMP-binding protein n=1 Tax=Micromonospora sp. NPDC049903 TaxID=3364276 RepID=UPI0037936A80
MLRTELIRPLHDLLRMQAETFGDKIAFRDDRRSVSYAELHARTGRIAGHLAQMRLQRGDRAAMLLGNCVELVESYFAITRTSAIGVPINPRVTETELAYLIEDSGARVIITDPAHVGMLAALRAARPDLRVVVTAPEGAIPGAVSYDTLATTTPALPPRDDLGLDDIAWMLYTSGTTGRPKGVLSTQRNCLWSVAACYVPIPGLTAEDRVLWPLPLFHSLSHIACVLGVTAVGATARILDGYSAEEVLRVLGEEDSTFLAGVPTVYHHLVQAGRRTGFRAPSLRMCLVGGAVTTAALRQSFEETFGAPLIDAYGSTETCGSITINWPTGARVEGSCGLPVPGLGVRVVDPTTGVDVPAGDEGEVWVRGPSVMVGYHNQPEATAEALRDGWYRTGDLARRDDAGYFTITGRIKELIIRGGENIHPGEVEEVLRRMPGVADVAVAGKPHEVLGEVPVAFLVPGPEGFDPAELIAQCRDRLSYFKVPEELYEIDRIPRTASGKITRHALLHRPARLRAASSAHFESLFRLDWIPQPSVPPVAARIDGWAVAGADPLGLAAVLTAGGVTVETFRDLDALRRAVADGAAAPEALLLSTGRGLRSAGSLADEAGAAAATITETLDAALADEHLTGTLLVVATRGAVLTATGDHRLTDLSQAAVWGAVRTAQARHPDRITIVDLDLGDVSAAALPTSVGTGESQLAIRDGITLLPRLCRVTPPLDTAAVQFVDPAATVLITGAESPVAAEVARHLVTAHGARRLLLTSRHGTAAPRAAGLAAELTGLGAEVELRACEVRDQAAVRRLVGRQRHPVRTIFHTELDTAGTVTLDAVARDLDLVAFVLLTSTTGVLGGPEAGPAAFACALAEQRTAHGLPGLALSLGPWDADGGPDTLSTIEALAMLDAAGTTGAVTPVAMRLGPATLGTVPVPAPLRALIDLPAAAMTPDDALVASLRDRLAQMGEAQQREYVRAIVAEEVVGLTGVADASGRRSFKDLGFTSLDAVRLRSRLTARTGLRLPTVLAFDHPNVDAVTTYLLGLILGVPERLVEVSSGGGVVDEPIAIVGMACRFPG